MSRAKRDAGLARALVCVASYKEAHAVLRGLGAPEDALHAPDWTLIRAPVTPENIDVLITGVGKANAAAAAARAFEPLRHASLLSVGICGLLPGCDAALGSCVLATESTFADEGALTPDSFLDVAEMGFPPAPGLRGSSFPAHPIALRALRPLADAQGVIATVSTCSGTNAHAGEIARRTGAMAEAMEGAAIALVAHRLNVPFGEIRVISNTTGDRASQTWDMQSALRGLEQVASRLAGALQP